MLLLVNNVHEKNITDSQDTRKFWQCARYLLFALVLQLCTLVATLHLCYMRIESFSANQTRVIFSRTLSMG